MSRLRNKRIEIERAEAVRKALRRRQLRLRDVKRKSLSNADFGHAVMYRVKGVSEPLVAVPYEKARKLLGEGWVTDATMNMTEAKISNRLFIRVLEMDGRITLHSRHTPVAVVVTLSELARRLRVNR